MGDTVAKRVDSTSTDSVDRRSFLKGAAAGAAGAASAIVSGTGTAQQAAPTSARPAVARPTEADARADFVPPEPRVGARFIQHPGSDYMVDVLKALDFDYVAVNPGSAFEGIHESLINHGGNRKPEILTVLHEEAGAAIAHGYAKAAGKPMMTLMHGTVGLLHASMGLFQAWCDRVPVFAVVGHNRNPTSPVNRPHSAQDMGSIVRDFMKMDDEPTELDVFGNIAMRAYTIGRTPPMGPTLLVVDSELQEAPIPDPSKLTVPRLSMPSMPQGDSGAVREAARLLTTAERPLIRTGKLARTSAGWDRLIELAELLQAPVDVGGYASWQDFPSWHSLVRLGRPRLPARRHLGTRAQRYDGIGARSPCHGRQDDQHLLGVSLARPQHPRLRQLFRGRRPYRGRRRSNAAGVDRGDSQAERGQRRPCAHGARQPNR